MKNKQNRLRLPALLMTAVLLGTLVGCSASTDTASGDAAGAFQMALCGLYLDQDAVGDYGEALKVEMPSLTVDGQEPQFTALIMGETENDPESGVINDPMLGATGMMKFSAMIAAGELDVVVSDLDNAARSARSDSFIPLDEILSAEEITALEGKLLSFEHMETDGYTTTPTGEYTPICGIDITGNEALKAIYGDQQIGVFIVANTDNPELAKEVMLALAS